MSIQLHTVDNGVVNAINDAKYYEKLTNSACGLVEGGTVTIVSANTLHITAGWGIILGRLFTISAEDINVEVSTSGTVNGRLKMVIDLSNPDTPISFASEARSSLPALTQEDLNDGGFIYEYALATYSIDELNATNITSNTPISIAPATTADIISALTGYVPTTRTVNGNALTGNVTVTRDQISGIVKSNTTSTKTLTMSLSGTTLTITYQ